MNRNEFKIKVKEKYPDFAYFIITYSQCLDRDWGEYMNLIDELYREVNNSNKEDPKRLFREFVSEIGRLENEKIGYLIEIFRRHQTPRFFVEHWVTTVKYINNMEDIEIALEICPNVITKVLQGYASLFRYFLVYKITKDVDITKKYTDSIPYKVFEHEDQLRFAIKLFVKNKGGSLYRLSEVLRALSPEEFTDGTDKIIYEYITKIEDKDLSFNVKNGWIVYKKTGIISDCRILVNNPELLEDTMLIEAINYLKEVGVKSEKGMYSIVNKLTKDEIIKIAKIFKEHQMKITKYEMEDKMGDFLKAILANSESINDKKEIFEFDYAIYKKFGKFNGKLNFFGHAEDIEYFETSEELDKYVDAIINNFNELQEDIFLSFMKRRKKLYELINRINISKDLFSSKVGVIIVRAAKIFDDDVEIIANFINECENIFAVMDTYNLYQYYKRFGNLSDIRILNLPPDAKFLNTKEELMRYQELIEDLNENRYKIIDKIMLDGYNTIEDIEIAVEFLDKFYYPSYVVTAYIESAKKHTGILEKLIKISEKYRLTNELMFLSIRYPEDDIKDIKAFLDNSDFYVIRDTEIAYLCKKKFGFIPGKAIEDLTIKVIDKFNDVRKFSKFINKLYSLENLVDKIVFVSAVEEGFKVNDVYKVLQIKVGMDYTTQHSYGVKAYIAKINIVRGFIKNKIFSDKDVMHKKEEARNIIYNALLKAHTYRRMPDIEIEPKHSKYEGITIEYGKYIGKVISADDILNLVMGNIIKSCQQLGGEAESTVLYAVNSENGFVFVIQRKGALYPSAESAVWIDRNIMVIDNIEAKGSQDLTEDILPLYEKLAVLMKNKYGIQHVFIGTGYSDVKLPYYTNYTNFFDIKFPKIGGEVIYSDAQDRVAILMQDGILDQQVKLYRNLQLYSIYKKGIFEAIKELEAKIYPEYMRDYSNMKTRAEMIKYCGGEPMVYITDSMYLIVVPKEIIDLASAKPLGFKELRTIYEILKAYYGDSEVFLEAREATSYKLLKYMESKNMIEIINKKRIKKYTESFYEMTIRFKGDAK